MTIVRRASLDMFEFAGTANYMVNPVNLRGAMGAGLAKEFKTRHPAMFDRYKKACDEERLKIGTIQVCPVDDASYEVINLPTKGHWADESKVEYVRQGLAALQRFLERPENQYAHVVMPMLGCGCGKLGYDAVEPSFFEYLDGLDAIISLSMNPDILGYVPKYLGIIGPRCWADRTMIGQVDKAGVLYTEERYQSEYAYVEQALSEALTSWGMDASEFDAFVSGGARGVDTVACGTSRTDPSYDLSLAKKYSKPKPVICYADWKKYGQAAGMIRNRIVVDIVTHIVVIRPPEVLSIGTTAAARLVVNHNKKLPLDSGHRKMYYIKGDDNLSANTRQIRMV